MHTLLDMKKVDIVQKNVQLLEMLVREQGSSIIFCIFESAISDAFYVDAEVLKCFDLFNKLEIHTSELSRFNNTCNS